MKTQSLIGLDTFSFIYLQYLNAVTVSLTTNGYVCNKQDLHSEADKSADDADWGCLNTKSAMCRASKCS